MRLKTMPLFRLDPGSIVVSVFVVIFPIFCLALPTFAQSNPTTLAAPSDNEIASALKTIKQVAKDGIGNEAAVRAMPILNRARPAQIPLILNAFNGSTALQRNWLMGAVNRLGDRRRMDLPMQAIKGYFIDNSNNDHGRLIAFELMTRNSESLKDQLVPKLINDPSLPLRYLAIADLIDQAEQLDGDENKPAAVALLTKALDSALDVKQIQTIAKQLTAKGSPVNLRQVMGFVSEWQIVAGFDNTESKGFDVPCGPELNTGSVDPKATYQAANDQSVQWQAFETKSETGVFDLNKLIGKEKDQTAYAYTVFNSPVAGPAEVRLGTPNAHKIWLNGKQVMSNEVYHNSNSIDKFVSVVTLVQGPNQILVKLCQNNQTQPWAQDWKFQLRFCDQDSKPIKPPSP